MRYLGLAALSAAVLLLQLTLTRVYSVTQGYHFAFLAVSLGLLGFGASGTMLFVMPRLWRRHGDLLIGLSALLFALATLASYWLTNRIPFDSYRLVLEQDMFLYMALFYTVQVVPFFFAGLALGAALSASPERASGLYGASLAGSGVGALLALAGPHSAGPAGPIGVVVTLGAIAWLALSAPMSPRRAPVLAFMAVGLIVAGWVLPRAIDLQISPYRALPQLLRQQGAELTDTQWNAFSRVDTVSSDGLHHAPGLSLAYRGPIPRQHALTVDADNVTLVTLGDPADASFADHLPSAAAYRLLNRPTVVVVEPGGGLDVLAALRGGAEEVQALVSNPFEAEALRELLANQPAASRVTVHTENPRGYFQRAGVSADLVVVSLRDAFRPITAGAYSLGESHIYTKEAFAAYLNHLTPGGLLMATRWIQTPPSEEMRVVASVIEALEEAGAENPGEQLAVLRTLQTLTVLAGTSAFTPGQIDQLRSFAESRQMDLAYLPGLRSEELNRFFILDEEIYYSGIQRLLDPDQRNAYYREQEFDVAPVTDDRPFFFHFFRWRQLDDVLNRLGTAWQPFGGAGFLVILGFLALTLVASTLLILVPLVVARPREPADGRSEGAARWGILGYFLLLGLAFLWIEIPLMQRFILLLDHPMYSFSVVLFSLLVFSGLGSLASPRLGPYRRWAVLALGILTLVYALAPVPPVDRVLGLSLAARVAITIISIAPLAFLMGIPFPTGIAAVRSRQPGLIPWAWGVNGYGSVLGSGLAALIALSWGFSAALMLAGAAYIAAWALITALGREGRTGPNPGSETPSGPLSAR